MARIEPLTREKLDEFEPVFKLVEAAMGFVPRSLFTMGHRPELLRGFATLTGAVLGPGRLDLELKRLISYVSSRAAGCSYCQAHTAHGAHAAGASEDKIRAAFEFDTSPLFSPRERAALRLANAASVCPNAVEEAHFEALREHFDEDEIVEIVAVIATFGFLNRWNDTVATQLEDEPLAFARETLGPGGWSAGKHA